MVKVEGDVDAEPEDKLFNRSTLPQGVTGEPAKLNKVSWDNLPKVSPGRSRLATPAPGTEKGSGLVDISSLLAKQREEEAKAGTAPKPKPKPAAPARKRQSSEARLATAAKAGGDSGLIELDAIRDAVKQAEATKDDAPAAGSSDEADEGVPSFAPDALSSASVDDYGGAPANASTNRVMLLGTVGLLLVVLGLLGYVAST